MRQKDLLFYPTLQTGNPHVNQAYRIAMGDLVGNVQPFQDGQLESPQPVILAGLDYDTPWTRDAAINVWNGLGPICPEVSRNTLLSVLERREGRFSITFLNPKFPASWGMGSDPNQYILGGTALSNDHSTGLVEVTAVAAIAAGSEIGKPFVRELWDAPIPSGKWRHNDGML